jgi:hypothetical protein
MQQLVIGAKYKHYKNHLVIVIGAALHSETKEELVVYKKLHADKEYKEGQLWVRPKNMFLEDVQVDGKSIPRFKLLEV